MPPVTFRPQPGRFQPPSATTSNPTVHGPRPTAVTTVSTPLRAPDGMEINAPGTVRTTSLTRAEVIARAKKADVPQRVQIGPTCGLYALGMVMDSWHVKDAANAAPLVSDADLRGKGKNFNFAPTTDERVLDVAKKAGFTSQGEMFTASQLAQTAEHFGYQAAVHHHATLADLYAVLDKGHPAIVGFDVDWNGNPGDFGGQRAHYAVIEGYFDQGGERYLVAKHGWGVEKDHVWKASDFERSWNALQTTDYYGTPGDGVIPKEPSLREPKHLGLPDAGNGRAHIAESLGAKIVEVVPQAESLVGGTPVDAPA